jgi:DNA-binding phage protein
MKKKRIASVSHHEAEIDELRADRELAVAYLKAAMEELDDPNNRAAGLLALRAVAEAYGGLGAVAAQAGISREPPPGLSSTVPSDLLIPAQKAQS